MALKDKKAEYDEVVVKVVSVRKKLQTRSGETMNIYQSLSARSSEINVAGTGGRSNLEFIIPLAWLKILCLSSF